ncbi:hypothetical protein MNB_SV-4-429 [hydrothermal vent metagenome]|uniref:Uncharacterized protein n=1 Tax=hydrothermal vent metagenome TaxID=652676 RepID=A0A1W1EAT6_9ZZZZ
MFIRAFWGVAVCGGMLWASTLQMTLRQEVFIAKKVWQNEGAGKDKYLVWWNDGEDFASLGIGHFIWFPKDHTERFREVFPMVVDFMLKRHVKMPAWLTPQSDFPWQSKAALMWAKKVKSKRYMELFDFLKSTMPQQAAFMAERTKEALPQMLVTIDDPKKAAIIKRRFEKMLYKKDGSIDERGLYILIDYTNFKGEGTLKSERYKGQGWGLLQVLEHLDEKNPDKYRAFADSAKAMLSRRIHNSPPQRGEERWRKGWFKRLDSYWKK